MAAEVVGPDESGLVRQLEQAADRVAEIRRYLERAERAIARPINGQDGEGAIEIVLGADGEVDAVHLDPDWRELLDERNLHEAVTEAYRAAHGSRLADWSGALRESLGARGLLPLRSRALVAEPAAPAAPDSPRSAGAGLDPDLTGIATDRPDVDVARDVLTALNAATSAPGAAALAGPASAERATREASGAGDTGTLRARIADAFSCLGTAISTAPSWLDVTLVVAGAQKVLDTLREVTEDLLRVTAGDAATTGPATTDASAGPWERLGHDLEGAAAQARTLLGIPEGLGLAASAVAELVSAQRSGQAAAEQRRDTSSA